LGGGTDMFQLINLLCFLCVSFLVLDVMVFLCKDTVNIFNSSANVKRKSNVKVGAPPRAGVVSGQNTVNYYMEKVAK